MKRKKSDSNAQPLFKLGQIVSTPGFLEAIAQTDEDITAFLSRHLTGDWGDLCEEDKRANDYAIHGRARILSAYHLADGTKFWIITEANRAATTFLLPSEY
jgi:hypothetical protein